MKDLWKTRSAPTPLQSSQLIPNPASAITSAAGSATSSPSKALGLKDQTLWSLEDNAKVFLASVIIYLTQRKQDLGSAVFDKDDSLAVDFVTAASNLRSACYDIPQQSLFDAKGMAGNIIHAIATTNAIVGGIIAIEAMKVLAGCQQACVTSFLRTEPSVVGSKRTGRMLGLIYGEKPSPPKPECMVCGKAQLHVTVNTETTTLGQLIDKVLKKRLAINIPSLNTLGGFWYEEGEDLEEDEAEASRILLPKTLASLPGGGLKHGTIVAVSDQSQAITVDLIITHQDVLDPEKHPDGFILEGSGPDAKQEQQAPEQQQATARGHPAEQQASAGRKKRSREEEAGDAAKLANSSHEQQQKKEENAKRRKQAADNTGAAADAADNVAVDLVNDGDNDGDNDDDVIEID
eukprot:GHRR01010182.1.p1 GENE.GHRR01010182.1~~GHRR01010182.1.p1  ORF type:complete len:405 (+),score=133.43 GHRR01010182.1:2062-3276(+)